MVSFEHEVLLSLFQTRPLLAAEVLRLLGVAVPAYTSVRTESADLTDVAPTAYRADLVVVLEDGGSVLGVVVEVQLDWDPRKRYSWPVYAATLRARLRCPVCVLVVTPTEALAKWCQTPVQLGPQFTFAPVVVGPSAIPYVTDEADAYGAPELAVLSVLAHGKEPEGPRIALSALKAVATLASDSQMLYSDVILGAVGAAAKVALEEQMDIRKYEFKSDFAKKHQAKGREEGREEGLAEGLAEGARSARVAALLAILDARGLAVSAAEEATIRACTDDAALTRWIRKAATAATVAEVFAEG